MAQFRGKVFKLYPSRYGGGSFRLDGVQDYFNSRDALPAFVQPGAEVEFTAGELRGKGRDVKVSDIRMLSQQAPPTPSSGPPLSDQRSTEIRYQASLARAIEYAVLVAPHLKLGKDPIGVIDALIDKKTAEYFEDTTELGALRRAEQAQQDETPNKAPASDDFDRA